MSSSSHMPIMGPSERYTTPAFKDIATLLAKRGGPAPASPHQPQCKLESQLPTCTQSLCARPKFSSLSCACSKCAAHRACTMVSRPPGTSPPSPPLLARTHIHARARLRFMNTRTRARFIRLQPRTPPRVSTRHQKREQLFFFFRCTCVML